MYRWLLPGLLATVLSGTPSADDASDGVESAARAYIAEEAVHVLQNADLLDAHREGDQAALPRQLIETSNDTARLQAVEAGDVIEVGDAVLEDVDLDQGVELIEEEHILQSGTPDRDPFVEVLNKYAELPIIALDVPGLESNTSLDVNSLETTPLKCDSIVYTAHSLHRPAEEALDYYRIVWSKRQKGNCLFLFLLDLEADDQIVSKAVRDAWRKRGSPHDPRILTHRYKAGLYLMSLIKVGRIRRPDESEPWILYVDGDTMLANVNKSVDSLVERVHRGTAVPTVEQRLCARRREISCSDSHGPMDSVDDYAIILSVSNNCHQGYYTHSGTFLFQACRTTAFLFNVLAESPFYEIDAGRFRMGDQGIWDWLLKNTFSMNWTRLRSLCSPSMRSLTRTACQYSDLLFSRPITLPPAHTQPHPLLQLAQETWFSTDSPILSANEPISIALVCVKWFNTPACPYHMAKDPLHAYQCGDMLWHLYGCRKEEWRRDPLHKLLLSEDCDGLTPLSLTPENERV